MSEIKIGDRKIVRYEYHQMDCEICGEPAMHKMTFLYENSRSNPASTGYGKDDISWCSDYETFCCSQHKREVENNPPKGMKWCSDFYVTKNSDGTYKNLDRVCYWKKIEEMIVTIEEKQGVVKP